MWAKDANRAVRKGVLAAAVVACVLAVTLAGCGGKRQDAGVKAATYKVKTLWRFPSRQPLGKPQRFVLIVRNVDSQDIPDLAVTVRGLRMFVQQQNTASNVRPVWLFDRVTYGDVTPNQSSTSNTFALGPLPAGQEKVYVLPLTPLRRGAHPIGYQLNGDLTGTVKLEFENGDPAADMKTVAIDPTPVFDESVFN